MKTLYYNIKAMLRDRIVRLGFLKRPAIRYCVDNNLFPNLFSRTPSPVLREMLGLPAAEQQTQLNQDVFALLMNRFAAGFFLEIGANDGFSFSNTVYLENEFGWKGILVEANKKYLESLARRTNSIIVNRAVSSHHGKADFIDAGLYGGLKSSLDDTHFVHTKNSSCIQVECMGLQEILDQAAAPECIDFVSIDVEGGEVPIVEQMVSVTQRFRCGCIEYNGRTDDYLKISRLLESAGYRIFWEGQTEHDLFFVDASKSSSAAVPVGKS